jgi:hypothetical protein
MNRERMIDEKSGARRAGSRKKLAGRRARAHDLRTQLYTIKRLREHASGADLNPEMVHFLRDGTCKR